MKSTRHSFQYDSLILEQKVSGMFLPESNTEA